MTRLAIISAGEMEKLLGVLGFSRQRQLGSHVFFRHEDGRSTVIPFHHGEDLGRGLIRKILRDIDITPEKYKQLTKKL